MARDLACQPLAVPVGTAPRPHYAAGLGLLLLGAGMLAAIDLVLLPRYLASRQPAVKSPPVATPILPPPAAPAPEPPAAVAEPPAAMPEPPAPAPPPAPATTASPAPTPPPQPAQSAPELPDLLFLKDTGWISPESEQVLDQLATLMRERPELQVTLSGHTDDLGAADLNRELSQRRARHARKWLVEHGIAPSRSEIDAFGSASPAEDEHSAQARKRNRRVEIHLR